jgi:hypothetical protein
MHLVETTFVDMAQMVQKMFFLGRRLASKGPRLLNLHRWLYGAVRCFQKFGTSQQLREVVYIYKRAI